MTREQAEFKHGKDNVIWGRPDLDWYRSGRGEPQPMVSRAKRFPKYAYGRLGFACLLHKIIYVDLRWYDVGESGEFLFRVNRPHMTAHCACGQMVYLDSKHGNSCEIPKPEAVLCGRCHGTGPIWPKNRNTDVAITKQLAKVRLGCVARTLTP